MDAKYISSNLLKSVPSWLKASLFTIILLFFGVSGAYKFSGISYSDIVTAHKVHEQRGNSIILDKRSKKYGYETVNRAASAVFEQVDAYGCIIMGAEPDYYARVLRVVARDGAKLFKDNVRVGSYINIDTQAQNSWMAMRSGIHRVTNISKGHFIANKNIKSAIYVPIEYQDIVIGTIMVFLERSIEEYSEKEISVMASKIRIQSKIISRDLYYSKDK